MMLDSLVTIIKVILYNVYNFQMSTKGEELLKRVKVDEKRLYFIFCPFLKLPDKGDQSS